MRHPIKTIKYLIETRADIVLSLAEAKRLVKDYENLWVHAQEGMSAGWEKKFGMDDDEPKRKHVYGGARLDIRCWCRVYHTSEGASIMNGDRHT